MTKITILVAFIVLSFGCSKKEDAPAQPPAEDKAVEAPRDEPVEPADEPKETDTKDTKVSASDGPTGIASCDEYLEKYEKCLQAKVPEEARKAMSDAFKAQRDAWVQSAEAAKGNEDVTKQLSKNCAEAVEAAKVPMEQYGCEW